MMGLLRAFAVACIIALVWVPAASGPYLYDDAVTPLGDPASQSLRAFASELPRTLRPLTKLTYAIEAECGLGTSPSSRREISIALLIVEALLVASLARALVPQLGPFGATAAGLAVGLHPIQTESVIAISGRSALLASVLIVGALLAKARDRQRLTGVLLLAACLARETAIAAVLPLVALELAGTRRPWREHARRLGPVMIACVLFVAWLAFTPRYRELASYSFEVPSLARHVFAQVSAIPVGLTLYVRFDRLTLDHGDALATSAADPWFLLGVALLVGCAVAGVRAVRGGNKARATGLALWLAAIVPTQTIVPKLDALTERPLALALVGLVIAIIACPRCTRGRVVASATSVMLAAFAAGTLVHGRMYRSELAVWSDAAAKSRTNPRPFYNEAVLLDGAGRTSEAVGPIRRAEELAPGDRNIERERAHIIEELEKR